LIVALWPLKTRLYLPLCAVANDGFTSVLTPSNSASNHHSHASWSGAGNSRRATTG
jgi:hypothetical protein